MTFSWKESVVVQRRVFANGIAADAGKCQVNWPDAAEPFSPYLELDSRP